MQPDTNTDRLYLSHMLECIEHIEEYAQGDERLFSNSRLVQDAVLRNLQTLAESSQRLSQPCKSDLAEIPWRAITGFRNILVHDYLGINIEVIWRVVSDEPPRLKAALTKTYRLFGHPNVTADRSA
jgi:uncharacterized protein with HEPN domain